MSDTDIMPAPEFPPTVLTGIDSKWAREFEAFNRMLPALLATHAGKYVAIHEGQVVESGDDEVEVAMRAYRKVGYVPMHVGLVSRERPAPIRIPSPRLRSISE